MVNPMESNDEIPEKYKIPIRTVQENSIDHKCATTKVENHSCECKTEKQASNADSDENVITAYDVEEALKDVIDPELGINIVDLGLVYGITLDENGKSTIDMTLTSPACPLTDVIETQVRYILSTLVEEVEINWVWLPPWGPEQITDDGKDQLRALGFNV
ncbi:metal-sulfur cluster assembly factor [Actinomyces sp. zg-332]|uniref:iron-sulfur cluster assembly protein n=1 Tax=Actinomyces sp. zg-332 TaxID=2708340 RepID=UPI00141E4579|nr:iron-sulfur cluster assembly protein [Actinomyces sp. zg-332]QPK93707.1 metal-sulfur cluster assembly factor [Actinomyces sp. zg-332]